MRAIGGLVVVAVLCLTPGCAAKGSLERSDFAPPTSSPLGEDELPTTTALGIGSQQKEIGVVVAIDGTLAGIDNFSIVLGDGSTIVLTPQPGLLFDSGPPAHLRDHLVSGSPIAVVFHQEGDRFVATQVGDAE